MSKFGPYDAFKHLFPGEPVPVPSRLDVHSWWKQGIFPSGFRPAGNRKAEPLFNLEEVSAWIRSAYSPIFEMEESKSGRAKRKTRNK
jgi:hypothetical protein